MAFLRMVIFVMIYETKMCPVLDLLSKGGRIEKR